MSPTEIIEALVKISDSADYAVQSLRDIPCSSGFCYGMTCTRCAAYRKSMEARDTARETIIKIKAHETGVLELLADIAVNGGTKFDAHEIDRTIAKANEDTP